MLYCGWSEYPAIGHHEVVIETPAHNRPLALMTHNEVHMVVRAVAILIELLSHESRASHKSCGFLH